MIEAFTSEWAAAFARWVSFVATSLVTGVVLLRWIAPDHATHASALRLVRSAGIALILAGLVRLAQQSMALAPTPVEALEMVAVLRWTTWGVAWHAQLLVALVAAVSPRLFARVRPAALGPLMAIVLCAVPAFQGHAFGSEHLTTLAIAGDIVHVVGSGMWMGTLAALALVVMPRATDAEVRSVVAAFSPLALSGASVLAATGTLGAWLHVRPLAALWESPYGLMLVRKLVIVAAILAIGAWNWKRLTPRLEKPGGVALLRRSMTRELTLGALVLLLTAFLVATPLPGE